MPVKSPILQISENLLFQLATSWRPHVNWNVLRKFIQENFMAKNYDFTFFSPKSTHNFQDAVVFFSNRQNNPNKIISTKLTFYPQKM